MFMLCVFVYMYLLLSYITKLRYGLSCLVGCTQRSITWYFSNVLFLLEENDIMMWASMCMNYHCHHRILYQFSIGKQGAVGKELEESNGHKEREGNGDSGYSGSQLESGVNSVVLEIEDDSLSLSQTSSDSEELHEASEKNRSTCILNPLSENLKGKLIHYCMRAEKYCHTVQHNSIIFLELSADKQVESSDSGYDCSQQSESESSESSVALEMEDDSMSLSQAALDEPHKSNENCPIPFLSDLGGKL